MLSPNSVQEKADRDLKSLTLNNTILHVWLKHAASTGLLLVSTDSKTYKDVFTAETRHYVAKHPHDNEL